MLSLSDVSAKTSDPDTGPLETTTQNPNLTLILDQVPAKENASSIPTAVPPTLDPRVAQMKQSASVSRPQISVQSPHTPLVTSSPCQGTPREARVSSRNLDIRKSEYIPAPVMILLDKWFQPPNEEDIILPQCAVTKSYAGQKTVSWVPSSNRRPVFEDSEGRKLQTQLYSLQKWTQNTEHVVLVVWNDFQLPVIIKGTSSNQDKNLGHHLHTKKFSCRVWKPFGKGITGSGYLKESNIFRVEQSEVDCDTKEAGEGEEGGEGKKEDQEDEGIVEKEAVADEEGSEARQRDNATRLAVPEGFMANLGSFPTSATPVLPLSAPDRKPEPTNSIIPRPDPRNILSRKVSKSVPHQFPYMDLLSPSTTQARENSRSEIKRSPTSSMHWNNLPQHDSPTGRSKRPKLDHPTAAYNTETSRYQDPSSLKSKETEHRASGLSEALIEDLDSSQATAPSLLSSSSRSLPSSSAIMPETAPAMMAPRESSPIRGSQRASASGLVPNSPATVDEYIENHVEIQFLCLDGSALRKRPLKFCNKVARLFTQARRAFKWPRTLAKILAIRIPGVEAPCEIAEGDEQDFIDFVEMLRAATRRQFKEMNGESLTIEVSEMSDE